jgi:spermidine/putrescine-binding protein
MALAAAVFATVAASSGRAAEFDGVTVRINSFGGGFDQVLKDTVATPLKQKFGMNVVYEPGTSSEALSKLIAAKGSPHLDILMIDSANMPVAIENGVIEELSEEDLPALKDLHPQAREFGKYGASFIYGPMALSYNKDRVKNPPASYKDLAKPEYKGQVAIFNLENNGGIITLLALAEANGGGVTNVAPAFEFLKQIKPNLVATPAANSALVQLFQQNEATVAANWTGRILALQAEGFPIEMVVPSEGLYSGLTYVNVVKGAKNRAAAIKYIEQQLTPAAQQSEGLAKKVVLYGADRSKMRTIDWTAVAKNRSAWLEQWNLVMRQ